MGLSVENLEFSYGTHKVLNNISFDANDGELLCLMGPNGVGKTTLFKCILGHKNKYTGKISIDNQDIISFSSKELASKLAYIPQAKSQNFNFEVLDVVLMGTSHKLSVFKNPGKREIEIAKQALSKVGSLHLANKIYLKLSGGEQQLVLIARALAQQTKILLMDEPTSALDYGNQNKIMSIVKELARSGYIIILSTHNPEHALMYGDRIIAIKDGTIYANGIPRDIIDKKLMKDLYKTQVEFCDCNGHKLMYVTNNGENNVK